MKENERNKKMQNGMERVIVLIYSIHMITMLAIAFSSKWSAVTTSIMSVCLVLMLAFTITQVKTFPFRAFMSTTLVFINLILYAVSETDYKEVLPMILSISVLSGLYGIHTIGYISTIATIVIYYYQFAIEGHIGTPGSREFMYDILQLVNVFGVQMMIRFWNRRRRESQQQMLEVIKNIEEAEKSKDDFLANVSHEIRTPVNTICGMSDLALQDTDVEQMKEKLWNIRTAGRHLTSIVSDVLDFSELQSENVELQEECYNITSTMNDIISMAVAKRGDKHIEFVVNCSANLPVGLYGDEKKLRRVIINLVDNAIKFTNEGGITITVDGRQEEYGINLCISVKDTGIGISEEDKDKLFTSFNQIDAKRNRKEGGMGLGLAISQSIVRKMGGAITFNSTMGKGSEFKLVVPQKVMDDAPIVTLKNPEFMNVATFLNMEQVDAIDIRDEYNKLIDNMKNQLGIKCHACMNLPELKRRYEKDHFNYIFIGLPEYQLDPEYFEKLAKQTNVAVVLEQRQDEELKSNSLLRLYKPFYLLSVASVLNGETKASHVNESFGSSKFTAPDAKVLVVDDNRMNIKVVEGLLAPYHMQVVSAMSGMEAINLVDAMDIDLVFMDHMMPEMDGVEAMHHIRDKGRSYFQKLPIIALTANAIAGTREMFMKEGFNDYVEKPVEPSVLYRALKRNLPEEKIVYEEVINSVVAEENNKPVKENGGKKYGLELGDLDVEKGLLYCGGIEKYKEILKLYSTEADEQRRNVTELFDKKKWKDYTIMVHAIKSSMFSIGAVTLSELAKKLESAGKNDDYAYIEGNHLIMMKEYNRVMSIIGKNFAPKDGEEKQKKLEALPEIEEEKLTKLSTDFENAAYALDNETMLSIISELEPYRYKNLSMKEELVMVKRKVDMSDFISASDALTKIIKRGASN